ncbi:hypothetical protein KKC88_03045 [Patescibacteria group bacterium]|nr:hypothetical protein [Patescibacteria group bacterium]MBU1673398.1 hypothetical protein [Patescibacteria group bacterium]MBU1963302.1 hypothetical protein [Patescibacteria group bacterium]
MKKYIFSGFLLLLILLPFAPGPVAAQEQMNIYLFHGDGCPHCAELKAYIENQLIPEYPEVNLIEYEVWYDQNNASFYLEFAEAYGIDPGSVPKLFIGDKVVEGYLSETSTGTEIENHIISYQNTEYPDPLEKVKKFQETDLPAGAEQAEEGSSGEGEDKIISYPLLGEINLSQLPLPALTVALGILDGFNPCAMWVLIFLIGLLLQTKDRKKMWIIGGTFLITSGLVYYFFMAAWLNIFLFVRFLFVTRIIIGIIAIVAGTISIKDFFKYRKGECKVTHGKSRSKTMNRIKGLITPKAILPGTLAGIIGLAFTVNLVELFCSAGLPAIFTSILSLSDLTTWEYYAYIGVYVIFFMIDDFIVFLIAMLTLQLVGFTGKFARWSNLIGGILILLIGLIFIFKPDLLMF